MTSITLKRLAVAVVSLVAVSAAFAIGYSSLPALDSAPHVLESANSWLASLLGGDLGSAWNAAAALAVMAVIAKRNGKT